GVPLDKSIIITFSEETWMGTRYLPRVFHTSRPAFSLGVNAANLLLRNIAGEAEKSETVLLDDNVLKTGIELPRYSPARKKLPDRKLPARKSPELRLLMLESSFSSDAIKILAPKFRNDYGVSLVIDTEVQDRLFNRILEDAQLSNPFYDIYMFDIPWLNFLVQNGFLEDISNFITRDKVYYNSIIKEILRNSMYQGRYYSIPFLGGAQLMFYRIDVFEDPILSKDYFNTCGTKLRPPRTWPEFNTVAKFFTRKYNRSSPVEFGASCHGAIAEEICPDIYSRIWGFGGQVFNRKNLPELYSENNIRAFENLIELQNYTPSPVLSGSILEAVRDFYTGKSAMLVTFTEYAAKIMDAINRNIFGKLGFTFIPARTPISVGWNLGINIFSRKKETALEFFNWLYRKDLSYYLTILGGQGTSVYPYENNELLKLYPWMQITIENFKFVRNRLTSHKKNSIVIPWNKIENIIYLNTKRMFAGESPETCLRAMDSEITGLMSVYGHFRGNN
ncbi:MAG: extracellular solute-binding protein, partial [Treponema sp.]|nr:extracellular solute-binding protein [Treponema sp.]